MQVRARIDRALKDALDRYCRTHRVVRNHFIQEAIVDRLEELEDVENLKHIRHEPTRPLEEVLAELARDGQVQDSLSGMDPVLQSPAWCVVKMRTGNRPGHAVPLQRVQVPPR